MALSDIARTWLVDRRTVVFPVLASKRPAVNMWRDLVLEDILDDVEAQLPSFDLADGLGMPTGERSGIVVVDVDGEVGHEWMREAGYPVEDHVGPAARTGRESGDGVHLYFKWTGERNSANAETKVDVRGEGGYVVIPPSLHYSGRHYEWISEDWEALQPIPESLQSRLTQNWPPVAHVGKTVHRGNWQQSARKALTGGGKFDRDGRNNHIAQGIVFELAKADVEESVIHIVATLYNQGIMREPLPQSEIDDMVKHAARRGADKEDNPVTYLRRHVVDDVEGIARSSGLPVTYRFTFGNGSVVYIRADKFASHVDASREFLGHGKFFKLPKRAGMQGLLKVLTEDVDEIYEVASEADETLGWLAQYLSDYAAHSHVVKYGANGRRETDTPQPGFPAPHIVSGWDKEDMYVFAINPFVAYLREVHKVIYMERALSHRIVSAGAKLVGTKSPRRYTWDQYRSVYMIPTSLVPMSETTPSIRTAEDFKNDRFHQSFVA